FIRHKNSLFVTTYLLKCSKRSIMNRTTNSQNTPKTYSKAAAQHIPKSAQTTQSQSLQNQPQNPQQQQLQTQQQQGVINASNPPSSVNGKSVAQQKSQPHHNASMSN